MSLDIENICRTCLVQSGPLVSIFNEAGRTGTECVADMLKNFTNMKPKPDDKMPEKVCLACISEINRCYFFKMKCVNSNNTLLQLLPNAVREVVEEDEKVVTVLHTKNQVQLEKQNKMLIKETLAERQVQQRHQRVQTERETLEEVTTPLGSKHDKKELEHAAIKVEQTIEVLEGGKVSDIYQISVKQEPHDDETVTPLQNYADEQEMTCAEDAVAKGINKGSNSIAYCMLPNAQTDDNDESVSAQAEGEEEEMDDKQKLDNETHLLTEATTVAPTHFCPRCSASFAYRKSLNYHIKKNLCTANAFACLECQRVFNSKDCLEEHRKSHLLQHACTECSLMFESKNVLSQHMIKVHKRSAKNQCGICNKVFTIRSTLKDHLRIHTGEKPFLCTTCGKSFRQKTNLKQHLMRHSQVKPYKCDECSGCFVSKAELISHKRTHDGDHPFKCDICQSHFTTSSSLVKHKRIHTGERPYGCEFCPMRFRALSVLVNHQRTHTGEKPYTCTYCNKNFTQKSDCLIHQRTHTGEKPYTCHCGSSFTHLSTLRMHQKIHDGEETSPSQQKCIKMEVIDDTNAPEQMTTPALPSYNKLQHTEEFDKKPVIINAAALDEDELVEMAMDNIN